MLNETLLEVRDLHVGFRTQSGYVRAVNGIDLDVRAGETIAIVGESGSGKSVTALAMLGIVRPPGRRESGTVRFRGQDLFAMDKAELRELRGNKIAMVFQDPMNSLDPIMKVGDQLKEAARIHQTISRDAARLRALELMDLVGIPDPNRRYHDYPFMFSGGMRQRMMIALAMCNQPDILVADEPTTALDVTIQAQVLDVFRRLSREFGTAVVLVTHNFGVVARVCDRVAVMYGGRVVEQTTVPEVFVEARHPYTRSLIDSVTRMTSDPDRMLPVIEGSPIDSAHLPAGCAFQPRCPRAVLRCSVDVPDLAPQSGSRTIAACWNPVPMGAEVQRNLPLRTRRPAAEDDVALSGRALVKRHSVRIAGTLRGGGILHSVNGVNIEVVRNETFGIVGESGCGKSSLARLLVRADDVTEGEIALDGENVTNLSGKKIRRFRRAVQMIFQDPLASMNPRLNIRSLLEEPLLIHHLEPDSAARRARSVQLLEAVGLNERMLDRYPREFSGGQLQRVAIARALAVSPEIIVCDEPVSALDVSLQAQVLNLLSRLQAERGLTFVFISHDVALVRYFTDRMAVMYLGTVVELGPTDQVLSHPLHPYTRSLIASVPEPSAAAAAQRDHLEPPLSGDLPSPLNPPSGCPFHPRCPIGPLFHAGKDRCLTESPQLREIHDGRRAACHFAEELHGLIQMTQVADSTRAKESESNGIGEQ